MTPWNLRAALLARHAQHVVLIHFPIALFVTGVIFDVAAAWTRRKDLATVAFWNLTGAALAVLPAALTGLLAWKWELEARPLKGVLLYHLHIGSATVVGILLVWWMHSRGRSAPNPPVDRWPLELMMAVIVAFTAHLGGFLTGVNHP